MAITTQDFTTITRNAVTAVQGASKLLVDLTVGSVLRAVLEANSAIVLWLQGMILQVLATTRAATSSTSDLDSFMADFGVTRLIASYASGQVTFSRFTTTNAALVPIGVTVQTADGTQSYVVTIDTTNAAYSASLGGYVIAALTASISAPVLAANAGIIGNSNAATISVLTQGISGVDTVTNPATFTNGVDPESDAALRIRFVAYIASLSKATKNAVGYAITSLQQNLSYTLTENLTYGGVTQNGYFYVVVDDGTGSPTTTLLSTVGNAIDVVRPVTSTFGVFAPVVVSVSIVMVTTTATGYDHPTLVALVSTALSKYVNSLALGATLTYSRLSQVAYDASVGITNVTSITLNGATADIAATTSQVIKTSSVTVS